MKYIKDLKNLKKHNKIKINRKFQNRNILNKNYLKAIQKFHNCNTKEYLMNFLTIMYILK